MLFYLLYFVSFDREDAVAESIRRAGANAE